MPSGQSEFLVFEEVDTARKTKTWRVNSKNRGDVLAEIRWYPSWRQYVLFPALDTVWNHGCLADINRFLREANDEHKRELNG